MKKNGFTLMEMLAVILIISIIALITFPAVNNIIEQGIERTYKEQVSLIERAAERWAVINTNSISKENDTTITLRNLINEGFIDQDELTNPKTNEVMGGCVKITYDDVYQRYNFTYYEVCN